jgi:hypothetical protein
MALPNAYLTSVKRLPVALKAIRSAQAPDRFSQKFLEDLGFTSSNERLLIGVLKSLGFLSDQGHPTDRYYRYLDETQSAAVLAEGVRDAYADLFQLNRNAHEMSPTDVFNKMRTLSQGKYSDDVLKKMSSTFRALAAEADFEDLPLEANDEPDEEEEAVVAPPSGTGLKLGGLVYNIQLHLPESRDPAVYDALFRSLRQHLLR